MEAGTECAALLQQIAALRGAANGLMAEVLESHFRETFGLAGGPTGPANPDAQIDEIMGILRTYLK
ncbi:hypothetical protein GCM10011491_04630 [Brucella endophytica]|uniref:Metal/formaldehyde-sensitive transcriptional repressor n=1 Tax=Brucella endophytica TaxID=1963359 RepID=A0A916S1S5_9HYPH|nr:hypothetical protein GCM10011491_04630 [Brucella endophytica]